MNAAQGKVLMLHGFVQSGKIFSSKTGGLRKSLTKLGYELYYPTAPILVSKKNLEGVHGSNEEHNDSQLDLASEFNTLNSTDEIYGWWTRKGSDKIDYEIEKPTIDYLHNYVVENGPFQGIVGFSQGAGLAGYLLTNFNELLNLTKEQQPDFKFFISFSGFKLEPERFQESYSKNIIHIPSLHVQGELDTVVEESRVIKLYDSCQKDNRMLLKHSGGHFIPNSKVFVTQVCNWLQMTSKNMSNSSGIMTSSSKAESEKPSLDDDLLNMIDSLGKI